MESWNQGHREIRSINDMVYMIVFVWRFKNGILYRLNRRMVYGCTNFMIFQFMASIAKWWLRTFRCAEVSQSFSSTKLVFLLGVRK